MYSTIVGQLAALRFLLGAFESCSTPSLLLITGMWYTAHEQPVRIAMWQCMLGVCKVAATIAKITLGTDIHACSHRHWRTAGLCYRVNRRLARPLAVSIPGELPALLSFVKERID